MKKKLFKKKHAQSEEMALQVTSMADIFTILLVFLLKSFASGSMTLSPTAGLLLPSAQADAGFLEALKVEITESTVLLEGQPTITLKDFALPPGELNPNGTSKTLSSTIATERERQKVISQANPDVAVDGKILVVADERTPYSTIKAVLASAAVHGYTDFKLAVIQKE